MGKVKEVLLEEEYNDRQKPIVEHQLNNLKQLNEDLIAVNEAVMIAYSRFSEMTHSILMLKQDDFIEVEDLCIEAKARLDYAKTYLSDIASDINDYYKPYDYKANKEAKTSEAVDIELRKFVADNVEDVEVCASGINNEIKYGYIKNKDLDDLKVANSTPIKTFKSI